MRHLSMTWWNGALYTVFSQVMIKNRKAYLYTPQEKFKKKKSFPRVTMMITDAFTLAVVFSFHRPAGFTRI